MLDYKFEEIYEKWIKSPCKKCIVQSCCTVDCKKLEKFEKQKLQAWFLGGNVEAVFFIIFFIAVILFLGVIFCLGFYKFFEILKLV
jgi:hypothetical protein